MPDPEFAFYTGRRCHMDPERVARLPAHIGAAIAVLVRVQHFSEEPDHEQDEIEELEEITKMSGEVDAVKRFACK